MKCFGLFRARPRVFVYRVSLASSPLLKTLYGLMANRDTKPVLEIQTSIIFFGWFGSERAFIFRYCTCEVDLQEVYEDIADPVVFGNGYL